MKIKNEKKEEDEKPNEEFGIIDEEKKALEEKIADFENKYKRALADYQNLEKRSQEERVSWIRVANKALLLRILPILDTLILASAHSEDQHLKVSVQLFLDTLKDEGITKVETIGKDFDPKTMECITTEEGEDGKVIKELRAGFLLHDTVLRPAQVIVGKGE